MNEASSNDDKTTTRRTVAIYGGGAIVALILLGLSLRSRTRLAANESEGATRQPIALASAPLIRGHNDTLYRIDIIPDRPPLVKITYPDRSDVLVKPRTRVLIKYEAVDDYGIAGVILHYKCDQLDNGAEKTIELMPAGISEEIIKDRFDWHLGDLVPSLPEESNLEFWLEAKDYNNVTAKDGGRGFSNHVTARVSSVGVDKGMDMMVVDVIRAIDDIEKRSELEAEITRNRLLHRSATQPANSQ